MPCGIQQRLNESKALIEKWVIFLFKGKTVVFAVVHLQLESAENSQWGKKQKGIDSVTVGKTLSTEKTGVYWLLLAIEVP